jgi:hypothetical protein
MIDEMALWNSDGREYGPEALMPELDPENETFSGWSANPVALTIRIHVRQVACPANINHS